MTQPSPNGQPQVVQPASRPQSWSVIPATVDGQPAIAVQIHHEAGVFIGFMPPEFALNLAAQLQQVAKQASTGLILPPGVGLS